MIDEPDVDACTKWAVHLAHLDDVRRPPGLAGEPTRQATTPHSRNCRTSSHTAGIVRLLLDDPAASRVCSATGILPSPSALSSIGAFALISYAAMPEAPRHAPEACSILPFAGFFYVCASDDASPHHSLRQAAGGEQVDLLMPALFAVGLAPALRALQAEETQLVASTRAFRHSDDIYLSSALEHGMLTFVSTQRDRVWNSWGVEPPSLPLSLGRSACEPQQLNFPPRTRTCDHCLPCALPIASALVVLNLLFGPFTLHALSSTNPNVNRTRDILRNIECVAHAFRVADACEV